MGYMNECVKNALPKAAHKHKVPERAQSRVAAPWNFDLFIGKRSCYWFFFLFASSSAATSLFSAAGSSCVIGRRPLVFQASPLGRHSSSMHIRKPNCVRQQSARSNARTQPAVRGPPLLAWPLWCLAFGRSSDTPS
jgi:hypothetical protein